MRQEIRLVPQQVQRMLLTQQMRQSLEILQLPTIDLKQLIEQQIATNPLLEIQTDAPPVDDVDFPVEALSRFEEEWDDYFDDCSDLGRPGEDAEERRDYMFNSLTRPPSLQDHLLEQLLLSPLDETDMEIGEFLIGNIGPSGYLQIDLEEVSHTLDASLEQVERVLKEIHSFDPTGVAARDLKECLLIQLESLNQVDSLAYEIVSNHLQELEVGHFSAIAETLGVTEEQVYSARQTIGTLDPKPGQEFGPAPSSFDVPEIKVIKNEGRWTVVLCEDEIPALSLNPTYEAWMDSDSVPPDVKKYLKAQYRSAQALLNNISQRQATLLTVAQAIVDEQQEFLEEGHKHLKPLVLRDVAEKVGLHPSTVSRASNKLMETPRGTILLKSLLSQSIRSGMEGEGQSVHSARMQLKEIIEGEDQAHPMSDQQLASELARQGVKLSRRTVAKYREKLGILPAPKRKLLAHRP